MLQTASKNEPTQRRQPAMDRIERTAKLVQNLTIILGVFAGAFALLTAQHDKRVQNVLALRNEFIAGVRSDYLKLMSDWTSFPAADKRILSATQDEQKTIVSDFFSSAENEHRFLDIVDFFDTLAACIEHRACDRNTAIYLFQNTAVDVFEVAGYQIEIDRNDTRDPTFARGLEMVYRLEPESVLFSYL